VVAPAKYTPARPISRQHGDLGSLATHRVSPHIGEAAVGGWAARQWKARQWKTWQWKARQVRIEPCPQRLPSPTPPPTVTLCYIYAYGGDISNPPDPNFFMLLSSHSGQNSISARPRASSRGGSQGLADVGSVSAITDALDAATMDLAAAAATSRPVTGAAVDPVPTSVSSGSRVASSSRVTSAVNNSRAASAAGDSKTPISMDKVYDLVAAELRSYRV